MTTTQHQLVDHQVALADLLTARNSLPQRHQHASYPAYEQAWDAYQTEVMDPLRQQLRDAAGHVWDYRGHCEDCGAPQPDYEPDDANMPALAAATDAATSTTYPWNQAQS